MIDPHQYERVAQALPIVRQVDRRLQQEIRRVAYLARIPAGQILFNSGDQVNAIPLLISGLVRIYQIGESGREVTLYRFRPGESCILTANSILTEQLFPAIAAVEQDAEALMIPADDFHRWVGEDQHWRKFVFDLISQRLASVMSIVDQVAFLRLDKRVATLLLERGAEHNPIHTTHQEIASELGSSREVISRVLDDLSGRGLIRPGRGSVEILDFDRLQTLAER